MCEDRPRGLGSAEFPMYLEDAIGEKEESLKEKYERGQACLGRLRAWTQVYGKALCPPGADTYGEGIRDAKEQVLKILNGKY